jgi:hypothetical protein
MKVNLFSLFVFGLAFFVASCDKEDDIIPQ